MKQFICIVLILSSLACAKSGGDSSPAPAKTIFSTWVRSDGVVTISGNGIALNHPYTTIFTFATGNKCGCSTTLTGALDEGAFTDSACSYMAGTGNGVDPGCAALNQSGTFSVLSGGNLLLCDSSCGSYN